MKHERAKVFASDWDFLNWQAQVIFLLIYLGTAVAVYSNFQDHQNLWKILFCTAGFMTLALFLLLRFSESFRKLTVKPDLNNDALLPSFTFPIILWAILPTVILMVPNGIL